MTTLPVAPLALALAALTLAAWAALAIIAVCDRYKVPRLDDVAPPGPDDPPLPRLSIIVTAHNEERSVERALTSLLGLRYADYEVIYVNDRSTDRTGEIAEHLSAGDARLKVLHIGELPPGWFGKPHAAQRGADAATGEILLFTDADVTFAPDAAACGARHLVRERLDHLAAAPRLTLTGTMLQACTIASHLLIGARQLLWRVQHPRSSAFFGVGSYTIMRADSYRAVGGHARVALRPDEDLRLGQAVKLSGMRSAFLRGEALLACPWYDSLGGFVRGLEKNFFAALDYSVLLVAGATATLAWLSIGPLVMAPLLLSTGHVPAGLLFAACPLVYWTVATTVSRDDSYPWWSAIPLPLAIPWFAGIATLRCRSSVQKPERRNVTRATYPILAALLATPAVAQDRPLTVDMTEVYRVGGLNAQEWAFFGPALQMSFDGAGNLLVLDSVNQRVVVIGPDGQLVRVVGREGHGPGEFQMSMVIAVWRDGRFAVPDMGHSAIQVFNTDGQLEHFVRLADENTPLAATLGFRERIRADPLGNGIMAQGVGGVLAQMANFANRRMGRPEDENPAGVDDRALETLDLSGDVMTSRPILQGWRAPRPGVNLSSADEADWSRVVATTEDRYFEPGFHWDVLPDGTIAYSDSSGYAIKLARPDGSVIDVLRRPLSPEAVSERIQQGLIASRLERFEERLAGGSSSAGLLPPRDPEESRQRIRDRGFYHEVPVVRGIAVTWDGGLWIQRRGEDPWNDDGPIDVFNGDREYLGTLAVGQPAMPVTFGPDGLVAHMERDELDVPTLVVSQLRVEAR